MCMPRYIYIYVFKYIYTHISKMVNNISIIIVPKYAFHIYVNRSLLHQYVYKYVHLQTNKYIINNHLIT